MNFILTQNTRNVFYEHESRESGEILLSLPKFFTTRRIKDSLSKKHLRVFRVSCVMLCYLSYFSNSEFFDLNSGTVRFISFTISGMFTSRLSFSSSFDAFKAS